MPSIGEGRDRCKRYIFYFLCEHFSSMVHHIFTRPLKWYNNRDTEQAIQTYYQLSSSEKLIFIKNFLDILRSMLKYEKEYIHILIYYFHSIFMFNFSSQISGSWILSVEHLWMFMFNTLVIFFFARRTELHMMAKPLKHMLRRETKILELTFLISRDTSHFSLSWYLKFFFMSWNDRVREVITKSDSTSSWG